MYSYMRGGRRVRERNVMMEAKVRKKREKFEKAMMLAFGEWKKRI